MKKILNLITASVIAVSLVSVLPSSAESDDSDSNGVVKPAKGYVCTYYEVKDNGWEKYTYDSKGNEIYREYKNGDSQIHKYTYYNNGKKKTEYIENNDGSWEKYNYDKLGNITYHYQSLDGSWEKSKFDSHGNCTFNQSSDGSWYKKTYTYFANGKIKTEDLKYSDGDWYKCIYDENGNIISSDDDTDGLIEYTYDAYGNETSCKHKKSGLASTRTYTYYNNKKVQTEYFKDTNRYWSKSTYDIMGNLTYTIDSDGVWTKYSYDSKGNKTYFEDSEGNWDKYTYDSKGNVTYFKNKYETEIGWMKYSYDSKGNMISVKGKGGYWEKAKYAKAGSKKSMKPISSIRSAKAVAKDKKSANKAMQNSKIKKLSVKSKSKNIQVSWKNVKKAWGYKVQVFKDKNFKKTVFKKNVKTNSININSKKIKKNKTYYVKVQTYASYRNKKGKEIKIYGKLSAIDKIKVK